MNLTQTVVRLGIAAALLGSLNACVVAPSQGYGYRAAPAYVETYPAYRPGYSGGYYEQDPRYYNQHDNRYYGDEHRHQEQRWGNSPLEEAARVHRDIRRSLGLPRLPGMP